MSAIAVDDNTMVADGTSSTPVTVTVTDASDHPLSGVTVALALDDENLGRLKTTTAFPTERARPHWLPEAWLRFQLRGGSMRLRPRTWDMAFPPTVTVTSLLT